MRSVFVGILWAALLPAQDAKVPDKKVAASPSEPGIPVQSQLVKEKCSGCHAADEQGRLTRISWERTTPEGWQQIVKRMVRLNHLEITPEEAREIVRALSDSHGLAPEEAAMVAWYNEKRQPLRDDLPDNQVGDACASCHSLARANSWRRSREEWDLLVAMHEGYFPVATRTSFVRPSYPPRGSGGESSSRSGGEGKEKQVDKAIAYLAKRNPLYTPEWASWQAARRDPNFAGRWLVSASLPGKGMFVGEMLVSAGDGEVLETKTTLTSVETGEKVLREGKAVVYTGYAWRGSASSGERKEREVLAFSRDQQSAKGRWFWGGYDEFGYDVSLQRAGAGPALLTASSSALKAGASGLPLRVYGDALPVDLKPEDINLGRGVRVASVNEQSPAGFTLRLDIDAGAIAGKRDLSVQSISLPAAAAVYETIDYISTSETALARLGGNTHPKGFVQFEAFAWSNGLDGKPKTDDDIALGPVAAKWSIHEFVSHMGDDDKEYVGALSEDGLFTPSIEGPNEARKFQANNYGDVWAVASYTPPGASEPLTAQSYLVVAIPLYVRWDQPEVAE